MNINAGPGNNQPGCRVRIEYTYETDERDRS